MKRAFRFSVHSGRFRRANRLHHLSFSARNSSSKINMITVCFLLAKRSNSGLHHAVFRHGHESQFSRFIRQGRPEAAAELPMTVQIDRRHGIWATGNLAAPQWPNPCAAEGKLAPPKPCEPPPPKLAEAPAGAAKLWAAGPPPKLGTTALGPPCKVGPAPP